MMAWSMMRAPAHLNLGYSPQPQLPRPSSLALLLTGLVSFCRNQSFSTVPATVYHG